MGTEVTCRWKRVQPESSSATATIRRRTRVLALARALRADGIDLELDQFHSDEFVDWPRWCNEQISREHSDFVLCICTAEFKRRIEEKVPAEKSKGVYWEGALLVISWNVARTSPQHG